MHIFKGGGRPRFARPAGEGKMLHPLALSWGAFTGVSLGVVVAFASLGCADTSETDLFGTAGNGSTSSGGDAGTDGTVDGGSHDRASDAKDAVPDVPKEDLGVHCGSSDCPVPAKECCRQDPGNGQFVYQCVNVGQCLQQANNPFPVPCDDALDCENAGHAGELCCVTAALDGGAGADEIVCRAPVDCTKQQGRTNLCDPNAPNPCPNGGQCVPSTQTIPGYDICR
jgi:hypothetical protein